MSKVKKCTTCEWFDCECIDPKRCKKVGEKQTTLVFNSDIEKKKNIMKKLLYFIAISALFSCKTDDALPEPQATAFVEEDTFFNGRDSIEAILGWWYPLNPEGCNIFSSDSFEVVENNNNFHKGRVLPYNISINPVEDDDYGTKWYGNNGMWRYYFQQMNYDTNYMVVTKRYFSSISVGCGYRRK